jgi:hypothetical protein
MRFLILSIAAIALCVVPDSPLNAQVPNGIGIFNLYAPIMVKIETKGGPDTPCRSEGSGFIVGQKNDRIFIATAAHVIPTAKECEPHMEIVGRSTLNPNIEAPLKMEARGAHDIALLSVSTSSFFQNAEMPKSVCRPAFGQVATPVTNLIFIGYFAGDIEPFPYDGRVENDPKPRPERQRIQGSANKGVSGGPVVDGYGRIIGVMRERLEKDAYGNEIVGKAYMTPISILRAELSTIDIEEVERSPCNHTLASWAQAPNGAGLPDKINVPIQLAELNDSHVTAPASDVLEWLAQKALGKNPPGLRYPRSYHRLFAAQPGYKFSSILSTRRLSQSRPTDPPPSAKCETDMECIKISPDGTQLIVDFRLWSGPKVDQTRGWIDMIILTEQVKLKL